MKKTLLSSFILLTSLSANADLLLGGDVEINAWLPDSSINGVDIGDSDPTLTIEASLEHFIPLVPNFKIGTSSVKQSELDYSKIDVTLYYEILDNDIVSVDLGVGLSSLDFNNINVNSSDVKDVNGYIPNIYVAAELGIPATPLFLYTKAYASSYDDSDVYDFTFGVQYSVGLTILDLELQTGYRMQKMDMEGFDSESFEVKVDGFFAGVNVDF